MATLPLVVTVELELDAVWTDISGYVRQVSAPLVITRGRTGEQGSPSPATCTFEVNNRDGRFSPRNPTGAYYGSIGRNTPVRVSVDPGSGDVVRFHGEMSDWPIGWDPAEADIWVAVSAAGLRRRLSQGQTPLRSPLDRYIASVAGVGAYWPMTDAAGSESFASALAGVGPLTGDGFTAAADSTNFPDIGALPVFASGSAAADLPIPAPTAVQLQFASYTPSGLSLPTVSAMAPAVVYFATVSPGAPPTRDRLRVFVNASTGAIGADLRQGGNWPITSFGSYLNTPVIATLSAVQNGADIDLDLSVLNLSTGSVATGSGTAFGRTLGAVAEVVAGDVQVVSTDPLQGTLGMVSVSTTAWDVSDLADPLAGYAGERAGDRITRLCAEEGTPVTVTDPGPGTALGRQEAGDLLTLLDEAANADGGILTEDMSALALTYRSRETLYDQEPVAVLDYDAAQIGALNPTEDDSALVNDLTVTRAGGSSARYSKDSGPLSVLPPPGGVGRYDSATTLSLYADDQLPDQASWRVHLGTVDEPRYPGTGYDLATPSLSADLAGLTALIEGDLLWVENPPTFAGAPDDLRLLVAGWSEVITNHRWLFTVTATPASGHDVGVYDDDGTTPPRLGEKPGTRYSPDTCVLAEDLTTLETGADVTTTGSLWSDADGDFDLWIGGERVTVTAVSGASNPQTLTLVRSANGVVKTHLSGAEVRLWQPAVYAL